MTRFTLWDIQWPEDDGCVTRRTIVELTDREVDVAERCDGYPSVIGSKLSADYDQPAPVSFRYRKIKEARNVGVESWTIGTEERCYGGPEEGGWWYDHFEPTRVFHVRKDRSERLRRLLQHVVDEANVGRRELSSVLSDGRAALRAGVEGRSRRPHYC